MKDTCKKFNEIIKNLPSEIKTKIISYLPQESIPRCFFNDVYFKNRWLENGFKFFSLDVKIDDLYFFYVLNQDIKSLTCSDENLENIYKTVIKYENSGKYKIYFKIKDDGNTRRFSFHGIKLDNKDPSKFSLIFSVNNLGKLEEYLEYYLHEYVRKEDKYYIFKKVYVEKEYINGIEI